MLKVTKELTLQRAPNPSVLFLGNSLVHDSIAPDVVADSMGLPPSDIASAAIVGGSIEDNLLFYSSLPSDLRQAGTVMVGVDPRDFFTGVQPSNRVRYLAGLSVRLKQETWKEKVDLTLGWVWRTWGARQITQGYLTTFLAGKSPTPFVDDLGRIIFNPNGNGAAEGSNFTVSSKYADCVISDIRMSEFQNLVDTIKGNGGSVVLYDSLLNPAYRAAAEKAGPGCIAKIQAAIAAKTGLQVQSIPMPSVDCPQSTDCFLDYGHTNRTGAIAFSTAMGHWLADHSSVSGGSG